MSEDAVVAWAAGVFEGEGCVHVRHVDRSVRLTVEMTDRDVVDRFAAAVGVGSVSARESRSSRKRPTYIWRASAKADVLLVLRAFRPWLGFRRGERADGAIAFLEGLVAPAERTHCANGHPFSGSNLLVVEERGRTRRVCRACRRDRRRRWYDRHGAARRPTKGQLSMGGS